MKLQFLGANQQVTGSRYFLEVDDLRLMIDCGMFQEREFLDRNWAKSPVLPSTIDHLLLTHAHLDHCGLIPRLVSQGFKGPIHATSATHDLSEIILNDSAGIQAEDAAYKRKRHKREGRKGPYPIEPLYKVQDVKDALALYQTAHYSKPVVLSKTVTATFHDAGHILGSSLLEICIRKNKTIQRIVFSGDLGQKDKPIVCDPTVLEKADYVVMESTYGDRDHPNTEGTEEQLAKILGDAVERGGNILVPTFAVERAQELLFYLGRLTHQKILPHLLVFLDSPMAIDVTSVFRNHRELMDEEMQARLESGRPMFDFPGLQLVRTRQDSMAINHIKGSCVILAGSGMCTAGRIKHHLTHNLPRPESTVVFVGYQARGTLGRELVEGRPDVRIHGQRYPVRAKIAQVSGLSAHADRSGLLDWLGHFKKPRRVFLTHGEKKAALDLSAEIGSRWDVDVQVPEYGDVFDLA